MAHFAKLDENNTVIEVIVINNDVLYDENKKEVEQFGIDFCVSLFGGTWLQTSYNANFRKNFAGIGYTYNAIDDAFIPVKEHKTWILDKNSYTWVPPIPHPSEKNPLDKKIYRWDDEIIDWVFTGRFAEE